MRESLDATKTELVAHFFKDYQQVFTKKTDSICFFHENVIHNFVPFVDRRRSAIMQAIKSRHRVSIGTSLEHRDIEHEEVPVIQCLAQRGHK